MIRGVFWVYFIFGFFAFIILLVGIIFILRLRKEEKLTTNQKIKNKKKDLIAVNSFLLFIFLLGLISIILALPWDNFELKMLLLLGFPLFLFLSSFFKVLGYSLEKKRLLIFGGIFSFIGYLSLLFFLILSL